MSLFLNYIPSFLFSFFNDHDITTLTLVSTTTVYYYLIHVRLTSYLRASKDYIFTYLYIPNKRFRPKRRFWCGETTPWRSSVWTCFIFIFIRLVFFETLVIVTQGAGEEAHGGHEF